MSHWDHWINKEMKPYLKKKIYDRTPQNVVYYPGWFDNFDIPCKSCKKQIKIDYLEKCPPYIPVVTKDGGIWQVGAFDIECNHCKNTQSFEFEMAPFNMEASAHCDDAFREMDDKQLVSFSIMLSKPTLDLIKFKKRFDEIKRNLNKNIRPSAWCIHTTDIWSAKKRSNFKHLSEIDRKEVVRMCKDFERLFSDFEDDIDIYNASGVFYKPKIYDKKVYTAFKERVYYALIMRVYAEWTKAGISPRLFVEATGNDGWAKNLFQGGRLTKMWPILTHGMPIRSPEFVPKNHDFRLDIADFVSFVIARYLYLVEKNSENIEIEFDVDTKWLGKVKYSGFKSDGVCLHTTDRAYPLKKFFSGTSWTRVSD